ncbi:TPA: HNH endonuclease [Stenotrophomonas maltophilia]|uniref:Putative HNH nuclease YajD n=1 Tax=Stenotrophomonas maltophilia TaxID=40324 RepID=A0AAW3S5N4_STEMA|nr:MULTISPECIES: HNH endonuclease signature motif containing protein [Stenotrophomonas]MBA0312265.1 HNH endonuclease [Stenotrophomonas maltophilia]MDH1387325.1 HNH endonuclease [Stenotrophomonas sp. GD03701]MDH1391417.1 HNH endonuclease [Stenotrophomonas sp. GD03702]HEL4191523.1 HNH endonuclease [Stenotrophomonas maltophilia]HEL4214011.1 HNH endonuclease [Stenotrophomonas maltophilia]
MPTRPPQHRAAGWRPYKETSAQVRKRQVRRALPTNSTLWRRIRAVVLAREPLCRCCAEQGKVRAATEVDHIDGDDANHADSNLQPLCRPCHSAKTARENGGFGRVASEPRAPEWLASYPQNAERKGRGEGQS